MAKRTSRRSSARRSAARKSASRTPDINEAPPLSRRELYDSKAFRNPTKQMPGNVSAALLLPEIEPFDVSIVDRKALARYSNGPSSRTLRTGWASRPKPKKHLFAGKARSPGSIPRHRARAALGARRRRPPDLLRHELSLALRLQGQHQRRLRLGRHRRATACPHRKPRGQLGGRLRREWLGRGAAGRRHGVRHVADCARSCVHPRDRKHRLDRARRGLRGADHGGPHRRLVRLAGHADLQQQLGRRSLLVQHRLSRRCRVAEAFPIFQNGRGLDEHSFDFGSGRAMDTNADTFFGQSGGPMAAFWDDGPYAVAVVSAQSSSGAGRTTARAAAICRGWSAAVWIAIRRVSRRICSGPGGGNPAAAAAANSKRLALRLRERRHGRSRHR